MNRLLILGDDLTGAADSAARCNQAGLPATIYLRPPQPPLPAGALAFTSDSRHLPAQEAAARVRALARPLKNADARWYKKIDSTLRGNIGSELDALLDLLELPCALVCPSFPAQGRGLRNGFLAAPNLPSHAIHLPSLLQAQSRRVVETIALAEVRAGHLSQQLRKALDRGAQLLVVDAVADEDLQQILAAVEKAAPNALLCGSAGLVGVWATAAAERQAGRSRQEGEMNPAAAAATLCSAGKGDGARVVLVVGSGSETAHRQIEVLCRKEKIERVEVGMESIPAEWVKHSALFAPVCLLHLPRPAPDAVLDGPLARRWAERLGEAAVAVIEKTRPELLILTGGDTAVSVLTRLGIDTLQVVAELLPGMPLCRGTARDGHCYQVIMKPGSFGDEKTLVKLLALTVGEHRR